MPDRHVVGPASARVGLLDQELIIERTPSEIDEVILKHLNDGRIDAKDLAGLLAHRLGTLMRSIDEKSKLWDVCQTVMKKQAKID